MTTYGQSAEPDGSPLPDDHWIHQATADARVAQAAKNAATSQQPTAGAKDSPSGDAHENDMEPEDRLYLGKKAK